MEKRSRHQLKAFELSLAFHALIIIVALGVSSSFSLTNRVMVIDFSIEDSENAGNKGEESLADGSSQPKLKPAVKAKKPASEKKSQELRRQEAVRKEEIVPMESISVQQAQTPETQTPVQALNEQGAVLPDKLARDIPEGSFFTEAGNSREGHGGDGGLTGKNTGMATGGVGGNSDSDAASKKKYLKENFAYIRDLIQKNAVYPKLARQMGWEGKVTVSFLISSNGNTKNIRIKQGSGIEILDHSSIEAVKKASPFPKPPAEAQIIIPISYKFN
jgi:protein TonB